MTSCKEFQTESGPKRTKFIVEIDITGEDTSLIVRDLKNVGWAFSTELAEIIGKD